jgi:hypothetical protein
MFLHAGAYTTGFNFREDVLGSVAGLFRLRLSFVKLSRQPLACSDAERRFNEPARIAARRTGETFRLNHHFAVGSDDDFEDSHAVPPLR